MSIVIAREAWQLTVFERCWLKISANAEFVCLSCRNLTVFDYSESQSVVSRSGSWETALPVRLAPSAPSAAPSQQEVL